MAKETNNGKNGGLLKGKRHYDKNGKPLGGIKAIVTDTGQPVELEGGEVIINREASKKHWRELSRINQSAGNGVPILPPDTVEGDTEEYKNGGNTIEFNPNSLPNKWVYEYAKKIKEKYPKVWDLGGNIYGNEAFTNLERAVKRGYWTEHEDWFYVKWKSFCARHKNDYQIAGVIANLKWLNVVKKGWRYMKALIEKEIAKQYPNKMRLGGKTPVVNKRNEKNVVPVFVAPEDIKRMHAGSANMDDINDIFALLKIPIKLTERLGTGAYGTAFKTNRGTVIKTTSSPQEAYSSFVIATSKLKSQAKVYNVFKITDGQVTQYYIEKEYVKPIANVKSEFNSAPLHRVFNEALSTAQDRVLSEYHNAGIMLTAKEYYNGWLEEFNEDLDKFKMIERAQGGLTEYQANAKKEILEFKRNKKEVIRKLYELFLFFRDLKKDAKRNPQIDLTDSHEGNFGIANGKYVCFDCVASGTRMFMAGGELAKGIKVEKEHRDTIDKLYRHKITPSQAPKHIAQEHLKEDKKYYTKLAEVEKKFAGGGNIGIGDKVTFLERGKNTPTEAIVEKQRVLKDGRHATTIRLLTTGKKLEVYTDRIKKADGGEQPKGEPKFTRGQYVIFSEELKDLRVGKPYKFGLYAVLDAVSVGVSYQYRLRDLIADKEYKNYIEEMYLEEAIKPENLPYVVGDNIKSMVYGNMRVAKIGEITTKLENMIGGVIKYGDSDNWFTSEVIFNIANGDWVIEREGTKPKEEPRKVTELKDLGYAFETPTGAKSELTYQQQMLTRTEAFKKWFGDWEKASKLFQTQHFGQAYDGVSKAIKKTTLEPLVVYHGTKTSEEFYVFEANRNDKARPYAYFALNKQYAENFTNISQRNKGDKKVLYTCFLSVKNPFEATGTGWEQQVGDASYWVDIISERMYNFYHKAKTYDEMYKIVDSQIGRYIREIADSKGNEDNQIPFWMLMAHDRKSTFKYFLISHGFDSIAYAEEISLNQNEEDYKNPAKFTNAFAVFDSTQVKLADGRNLDFDAFNPDIRYEDGGNLTQHTQTEQAPQTTKKDEIGKVLFGDKYKFETGGNLTGDLTPEIPTPVEKPQLSTDRAYVESLIAKMKQ